MPWWLFCISNVFHVVPLKYCGGAAADSCHPWPCLHDAAGRWAAPAARPSLLSSDILRGAQPQVEHMTAKWHVYMTLDGRISMAGLNQATCGYLAEAMADALRSA